MKLQAVKRVETRVKEGGHSIPEEIIRRRYHNGLSNFFNIFESIVDEWMFIDNSGEPYEVIANKADQKIFVENIDTWNKLFNNYKQ